jgi:multidrug efflux pump
MSRFFIDHPVFAWVIAIALMLFGAIALASLPVAQYPAIAPPAISITVTYPGASAETVQSTVVQVIEQQLSGLDHLEYFSSLSNKDGSATITLSFAQGTNSDIAQVQVQNKLQLATPRLPAEVQTEGVTVAKATKNFLLVAGLVSTDGSLSSVDLSDLIVSQVQDPISRTNGVGDFQLFGSQYAMRIWLDPAKLDNFSLTTVDVASAITAQNVQVAAGELGGLPARAGQQLNATIIGPSYLDSPAAFGNILLKVLQSGAEVRLRDVARIELGAESYSLSSKYNGKPASGIAVKLAAGANALDTVAAVHATMQDILPNLPAGVEVIYPYDTSPFVRESIKGVVETLGEAIVLVFLILFLFLQNFRATLIPTIAVPVVLLGTCGVLSIAGYSINSLTLFAMVLAIGLLVDDAIVVVENVERVMRDEKLDPKEATRRSMDQISGALIGIAMVLTAVFLPMAFFAGSAGVIYRQFSITIVSAMLLSVAVALIFTPALCSTLLRAPKPNQRERRGVFYWFNRGFDRTNKGYSAGLRGMLKRPIAVFVVFALLVGCLALMFLHVPSGFLPDEDQGVLFVQVATPPGATAGITQEVLDDIETYFRTKEAANVASVFTVNGFSFGGQGQNAGLAFVILKDWSERAGAANKVDAIVGRGMGTFSHFNKAQVFAFAPPAVLELGNATGFDFELLDHGNKGHAALMAARGQLLGAAAHDPALAQVRPNGPDDEPQYRINFDREKASALGLTIADINNSLAAAYGSSYVNDFIDRGRVKRVFIQGDINARMEPGDLANWFARNSAGTMTPFSIFGRGTWITGSPRLERYGGIPSIEILGSPAPGQSTGTAIAAMQRLAANLPAGFTSTFTGLSYEELEAGSQTIYLYALAITVVFLSLAALYESWAIPLAVLLVIPLGVLGVVAATLVRGLDNNVYFQVGMLTTIGLASKNAILIVEFADAAYEQGKTLAESALLAAAERLRPILMTSLAFMLGVLPLAISSGAGSGGQNAIGTAVVGGMLSATVLAIFFVPVFFVVVLGVFRVKSHFHPAEAEPVAAPRPAPAE